MATDSNWPKEPYSTILPFPQNTTLKDCTTLLFDPRFALCSHSVNAYFPGFEALNVEQNFAEYIRFGKHRAVALYIQNYVEKLISYTYSSGICSILLRKWRLVLNNLYYKVKKVLTLSGWVLGTHCQIIEYA